MMSYDFHTTTHAKWILAGEHAVLRGHSALVFPIPERQLSLSYQRSQSTLSASYSGSSGEDMHLSFWSVLEQGQQLLGKSLNHLSGQFHLFSNIPVGVGMGASAALCVAIARWFASEEELGTHSVYSFAKKLENMFHEVSSGIDIAGVAANEGIYFQQDQIFAIKQTWKPYWYLSACNQVSITSHCVNHVENLRKNYPVYAANLDNKMNNSVLKAKAALENNTPESLKNLAEAIQESADCFNEWGLISENLQNHMQSLLNLGALAAKPTGSGKGGYIISLWNKPPTETSIDLLAV